MYVPAKFKPQTLKYHDMSLTKGLYEKCIHVDSFGRGVKVVQVYIWEIL